MGKLFLLLLTNTNSNGSCIKALYAKIHSLERTHKLSLATKSLVDLIKAREELLEELNKFLKRKYILTQKLFYEFRNKSGKLLARELQSKKATNTIHTIRDSSGSLFAAPADIANQFVHYFSDLYNLPSSRDKQATIREFLLQ